MNILSGDPPRGRALQLILVLVILALVLAPFLFPGAKALNVAAKTCVMILLVASYDLLLGYAGIVSFAHVMFFGVGAYGVGLALYGLGAGWGALGVGLAAAAALSLALALAIGLFSLRVQSIFFAMVTLAVAYAFNVLASQLSWLTGGEDGRSFKVPDVLQPGFRLIEGRVFGVAINGKILTYYLVLVVVAAAFLVLLRVVNSPFGRVLQAIRENPFRAEALGYRTVFHRTLATSISALGATLAGGVERALAALRRAGHGALVFDPGRRSGDGRRRRHGIALWRDSRRGLVRVRRELSAGRDGRAFAPRRRRAPAAAAGVVSPGPLAVVARSRLRACGLFRADRYRRSASGPRSEGELTRGARALLPGARAAP